MTSINITQGYSFWNQSISHMQPAIGFWDAIVTFGTQKTHRLVTITQRYRRVDDDGEQQRLCSMLRVLD